MAIIDTTNVVESTMFLKSKLPKNMVGDNYYIQTLQQKIDAEWDYRFNVVDIEEEKNKQIVYTKENPIYTPVEVVVQTVKTLKGEALADDWKMLVFKKHSHNNFLGKRFRFNLDFDKGASYLTEEEKWRENSVWIAVNREQTAPTNGLMVRRCNTNIAFVGSPTRDYENITEVHYEPCVLESDFKYINLYYNSSVNIAQAEIYATFQYNYFTQNIKVNDRMVIGDTDTTVRENNMVFKVKAVNRFLSQSTFKINTNLSLSDVPLVIVALDRDTLNSKDDFERRIAFNTTIYKVETDDNVIIENDSVIEDNESIPVVPNLPSNDNIEKPSINPIIYNLKTSEYENKLLQEESQEISFGLYNEDERIQDAIITYSIKLGGVTNIEAYCSIEKIDDNTIKVLNNRMWLKDKLQIELICDYKNITYTKTISIQLGGFY